MVPRPKAVKVAGKEEDRCRAVRRPEPRGQVLGTERDVRARTRAGHRGRGAARSPARFRSPRRSAPDRQHDLHARSAVPATSASSSNSRGSSKGQLAGRRDGPFTRRCDAGGSRHPSPARSPHGGPRCGPYSEPRDERRRDEGSRRMSPATTTPRSRAVHGSASAAAAAVADAPPSASFDVDSPPARCDAHGTPRTA